METTWNVTNVGNLCTIIKSHATYLYNLQLYVLYKDQISGLISIEKSLNIRMKNLICRLQV